MKEVVLLPPERRDWIVRPRCDPDYGMIGGWERTRYIQHEGWHFVLRDDVLSHEPMQPASK